MSYFIGLLSGTSVDGIDAALVKIDENTIQLLDTVDLSFSSQLTNQLQAIIQSQSVNLKQLSETDIQLAIEFSQAIIQLLNKAQLKKKDIVAIGSHGQTIFHQPNGVYPNTLQIGSAHKIAANTDIMVVSNFRNLDMAYGGQGAPLAPIIHEKLFKKDNENTAVVNLGGIANISFIGKDFPQAIGFDTGPAICLLDEWIAKHKNIPFDNQGTWAKQGQLNPTLLKQLLADDYFDKPAPKSTGREYFNLNWLQDKIADKTLSAVDIQNTLTHLTALSVANAVKKPSAGINNIVLMGGGAKNIYLTGLIEYYSKIKPTNASTYGFDGDWIEAILFAYLAYKRVNNQAINLSSFTGSSSLILVGDIIQP